MLCPSPTGNAKKVDENGVPICPGGMLMRKHGYSNVKHRIYYNCPVKRPSHRDGEHIWLAHVDQCPNGVLCSPHTRMSPVVYVKATADPGLYPPTIIPNLPLVWNSITSLPIFPGFHVVLSTFHSLTMPLANPLTYSAYLTE